MPEESLRYTGFGRLDAFANAPDDSDRRRHQSIMELSYDVHDMWLSSLEPGTDTPFEPSLTTFPGFKGDLPIDVANIDPETLPPAAKMVSYASAVLVSSMVESHIANDTPLDVERVEKMGIYLYAAWSVVKHNNPVLPAEGADVESSALNKRLLGIAAETERVRILDRRIVLAGIASQFDDERFPMWQGREDVAEARTQPNVQAYARKGRRILEAVKLGRPVPLGTEPDNLYLLD